MTAKEDLELTEAIEELDRTDGLTDEELEAEAIETYGSKAEELDYIIERLSALNRRDYYRFRLALRYHRKALIQQSKIELNMMPEMRAMKEACDRFLAEAEQVLGKLKEEAEDEQN